MAGKSNLKDTGPVCDEQAHGADARSAGCVSCFYLDRKTRTCRHADMAAGGMGVAARERACALWWEDELWKTKLKYLADPVP